MIRSYLYLGNVEDLKKFLPEVKFKVESSGFVTVPSQRTRSLDIDGPLYIRPGFYVSIVGRSVFVRA